MKFQHRLYTSLRELVVTHAASIHYSSHSHLEECRSTSTEATADDSQADPTTPTPCTGIICAIHTVLAWASGSNGANQLSPVPQQHLLMLLQALTQPSDNTAALTDSTHDIAALSHNCRLMTDAAVQLCSSAAACAGARAGLHTSAQAPAQPDAKCVDTNSECRQQEQQAPLQVQQQQHSHQDAAAAASAATNHSMALLFWSCHLTTALHQVRACVIPTQNSTIWRSPCTTHGNMICCCGAAVARQHSISC